MKVRSVSATGPTAETIADMNDCGVEALIVYCARVSNPENQKNSATGPSLLKYCIDYNHWSVFEMVDWTVEIETSRAIAAQILRHRSFAFQEFSQRYSNVNKLGNYIETPEMRAKHVDGNRQGSGEVIGQKCIGNVCIDHQVYAAVYNSIDLYQDLIKGGVAPECARMVLPLCTKTRLYMKGSIRSWIHYLQVRCDSHAQKEHMEVADAIKDEFVKNFPCVSEALGWKEIE